VRPPTRSCSRPADRQEQDAADRRGGEVHRQNADGSLLLEPASVVSEAQETYDADPDLKALLERALDALERDDPDAYRDAALLCRRVFDRTGQARAMSSAITAPRGIVMRLAVPRQPGANGSHR